MPAAVAERGPVAARRLGLSEEEAAARQRARGRLDRPRTSRSYASIVVANVFTVFNGILMAFRRPHPGLRRPTRRALLGVVVANATIGILQEVRAKGRSTSAATT